MLKGPGRTGEACLGLQALTLAGHEYWIGIFLLVEAFLLKFIILF